MDPLEPPTHPAADHRNDRKAWLMIGTAAVVSLVALAGAGRAVAYRDPGSFSSVAQQELRIPALQELTPREVRAVGRDLCDELGGSATVPGKPASKVGEEVATAYAVARPTGDALVKAALTHLCPEVVPVQEASDL
ncbi:DUF732 domain-containing protein [Nocardioides yefusunii]|uniref:DUF732 domain-containing protein n=1 Tax=Nocardioides yefusunii TaxID=2500546 RepID=A0ABW1QSD1_9ACTN|nr:DUF732 domain-containing protein [Nocardioides yefusunii]